MDISEAQYRYTWSLVYFSQFLPHWIKTIMGLWNSKPISWLDIILVLYLRKRPGILII